MRKILFIIIISLLIYSRFAGLNWGLPYPMHPDERNMANAIQGLNCEILNSKFQIPNFRECGNPHFFAYGQLSLYVAYLIVQVYHFIVGKVGLPIATEEAIMSLRLISAIASIINVFVLVNVIELLIPNIKYQKSKIHIKNQKFFILNCHFAFYILIFAFSPYFIQFSHFGTTEALLMLFYSLIIYYSLQLFNILKWRTIVFLSLFSGLSIATKVSAIIFIAVPTISIISNVKSQRSKPHLKSIKLTIFSLLRYILRIVFYMFLFLLLTAFFTILFSPHNLISFREFVESMNYESAVALGEARVFYTRQFEYALPILFQAVKIFPYVLGWPQYILAILGLFLLSWRKKEINLLRLAFLIYFIPNAFFYAKWTRFMTPILPIMSIFAVLFTVALYRYIDTKRTKFKAQSLKLFIFVHNLTFCILIFTLIVPGIAYLSIYQSPDVRFATSKWIYENISKDSYILYETANVVDVPLQNSYLVARSTSSPPRGESAGQAIPTYHGVSFNYYDIDSNVLLREEFNRHLAKADYIFIPSRRVFANHTCYEQRGSSLHNLYKDDPQLAKCRFLKEKYPLLNDYYQKLFSGELGFKKVAEFSSYPKISLFGKTLIEFPDEEAEETWTVFDHPVIRIYKRV